MELEKSQFGNPQTNTCFKQDSSRDAKGSTCEWPRTDLQGAPYKDAGVNLGSLLSGAERVGGARHVVWKEGYEAELGKGRSLTAGQAYQGLRPLAPSSEAVQPLLTPAQNAGMPRKGVTLSEVNHAQRADSRKLSAGHTASTATAEQQAVPGRGSVRHTSVYQNTY